jgi:Icc-related predicted phosphoesterase
MIRLAAVGDIHLGADTVGDFRASIASASDESDLLLLAGDLSRWGAPEEADLVTEALEGLGVPVVAVLGNHDHHAGEPEEFRRRLEAGGITVLEGEATEIRCPGGSVGVAGAKGFGGGFLGASASAFGEPEMKAFVEHTESIAGRLRDALTSLDTDARVALLHYSPVADTLQGEPLEIYPFLGSYLLAEAIDDAGATLALHGHAHAGVEHGTTAGGVPVRNVAMPVIRSAYQVYELAGRQVPASMSPAWVAGG